MKSLNLKAKFPEMVKQLLIYLRMMRKITFKKNMHFKLVLGTAVGRGEFLKLKNYFSRFVDTPPTFPESNTFLKRLKQTPPKKNRIN